MKALLVIILLLLTPQAEHQFTFQQIFGKSLINLNDKLEGTITLENGTFKVIITIYYRLDEEWVWADLILRLNNHEIRIHLSGDKRIANASNVLELENPIRIKLTAINVLANGVIYRNSTIEFIRLSEEIPQNENTLLMPVAFGITAIPVFIQLIRRRRIRVSLLIKDLFINLEYNL